MKDVIIQMVERYSPQSMDEYDTALKEIIQRICLLGLWRAKFFEHAAFYGGTALRLLYGLDRFSEDLDFSLLSAHPQFELQPYFQAVHRELLGFGFEAEITEKNKENSPIATAFVKANTRVHRLSIGLPERLAKQVPGNQALKVKFEVDTDPPLGFHTQIRYILQPVPFSVRVFVPQDLFAGKMHALLFRKWGRRVKGRDWYDLVWFVSQEIPLHLEHLTSRMRQTGDWELETPVSRQDWERMFGQAIAELDVQAAKRDVLPFVQDASQLDVWSAEFFSALVDMVKIENE
ncbi:nucleotidyl transferase AbiEii/AbiGii toxin family protein [Desulfovermiculus halophilus]|uniref:nucleotidyl transferase AbiEii/AbiGii toxin family protein n=1 Tax=Desulfovermiculus halophilus TaxID=339722 RepID=UPI0004828921|nr:nucleotidyl transferase AbiEii/AbiGii toxin family protein [Desulfovermiculus halophilus]